MAGMHVDPITSDLTDVQRQAVCHGEGPLLIVAGAGTGKTRVITRRAAHLAREGVPPGRMLAITFTNKAADEMRRRIEALVGQEVLVATFHSFCARLLRREAGHLGLDPSFSIYDRGDSLRVVKQVIKAMKLDPQLYRPSMVLERISLHKERLEPPEKAAEGAVSVEENDLAEAYRRYDLCLRGSHALDFDDLLLRPVELFNAHPEVLQHYQERYLHVLVDEYQDTNLPQHLLARALQGKHRNITAVGDPDQMIYTWRGARLENIMQFKQDFPGAHIIMLERNYRSSANILGAASQCISYNRLRHQKVLWTESAPGEAVLVAQFETPQQEGEWIAQRAGALLEEGAAPGGLAVLYRTNYQSAPLESAFASRGLPYQVMDTVAFFERRQVKDLRAYMQLLANPRDDEALRRIINVPTRGIGQTTVQRLQAAAAARGLSLLQTAGEDEGVPKLGARAVKAVRAFRQLYDELAALPAGPVRGLVKEILKRTHYLDGVPAEDRAEAAEVIDVLLDLIKDYDERAPEGGLTGFLEQAALVSDQDGLKGGSGAAALMTLHSAKGLEFDVVFVCGLEEGILPHERALQENPYGSEDYALEEERRLLHVGMTRARHLLYLTWTRRRQVRGVERYNEPSRFLFELPTEGIQRFGDQGPGPGGPAARSAGEPRRHVERKRAPAHARPAQKGEGQRVEGGAHQRGGSKGGRLVVGAIFKHGSYGEGTVVGVESAGKRQLVRVDFPDHGVLTLLF